MRRLTQILLLSCCLIANMSGTTLAASEHEGHHPTTADQMPMMHKMMEMPPMPCMVEKPGGGMMGKDKMSRMMPCMGDMMGPGMNAQMEHMLFIGQAEMLGLSADQVSQLKAIHAQCRKDNIRNAAEIKIAKLELADLLAGDDWALSAAEALVRKVQTLQGDLHLRHLKALHDARQVLTPDQRQKARKMAHPADLEELFK